MSDSQALDLPRPRVVVFGPPEAGKSTLVAALSSSTATVSVWQGPMRLLAEALVPAADVHPTGGASGTVPAGRSPRFCIAPTDQGQLSGQVARTVSADVALVVIDVRDGMRPETKRQCVLAATLGIRRLVLAVNKIDLVAYERRPFASIVECETDFFNRLELGDVSYVPISVTADDNVKHASDNTPWYTGASLLAQLDESSAAERDAPFRFRVQAVTRATTGSPECHGVVLAGSIRVGAGALGLSSGRRTSVAGLTSDERRREHALAGDTVTIRLEHEITLSAGDLLADPRRPPERADQFAANVVWFAEEPMLPGREYSFRTGETPVAGQVSSLRYRVNPTTGISEPTRVLQQGEIGRCNIQLAAPVPFDSCLENVSTSTFVVTEENGKRVLGAGVFLFALRHSTNIHWQAMLVDKQARALQKKQRPRVLWFTGLSGSGKSTIAKLVDKRLWDLGFHTYVLDGDNIRHGINRDLGFTDADRVENIRRVIEIAHLFADAGLIVLVSFISPFRRERQLARERLDPGEFLEIFVNTPLEVCESRDPKGLYRKARIGQLHNFTGIDSDYEPPLQPDLVLNTIDFSADELADLVVERVQR